MTRALTHNRNIEVEVPLIFLGVKSPGRFIHFESFAQGQARVMSCPPEKLRVYFVSQLMVIVKYRFFSHVTIYLIQILRVGWRYVAFAICGDDGGLRRCIPP